MQLRHILVVALPDEAEPGPAWAVAIGIARLVRARVTVLGVPRAAASDLAESARLSPGQLERIAIEELREELARLVGPGESREVELCVASVSGVPFIEIIRAALREHCDLVVASANPSPGLQSGLFGSTIQHLFRKCPVPVWAVKSTGPSLPRRIAVAISTDPEPEQLALDRRVLAAALALAAQCSSELHIVHAVSPLPTAHTLRHRAGLSEADVSRILDDMRAKEQRRLEELLASTRRDMQKCSVHLLDGDPRLEIPRHVARESIDLLVLGTVARTGIAGLLIGNTAEEILRRVDCSVLALKPDGFESPVKLP